MSLRKLILCSNFEILVQMKKLLQVALFPLSILILLSCNDEFQNFPNNLCEVPVGIDASEQLGRIYKWTDPSSSTSFHYIGNVDQNLKHGGFVPCNTISGELIPDGDVGDVVRYSGKIKMAKDACEPMYFGIELSSILKEQ